MTVNNGKKIIWTKYQDVLPCYQSTNNSCSKHRACNLWHQGWRVCLRKFLWFKWLEFTKDL